MIKSVFPIFFPPRFLLGAQYENSSEIGVFTRLTNAFCIMAEGGAEQYRLIEAELSEDIPVVRSTLAGTRLIGRLCVGNTRGKKTAFFFVWVFFDLFSY